MNENFFQLPDEKRLRIINAGFEVLSQSDYRKASTEEIASKAGISKALLFYYFHNKKTLYLFLYDCAQKMIKDSVLDAHFLEITDFFELCEYAAQKKFQMLIKSPHIMDFGIRAFCAHNEEYSEELNRKIKDAASDVYSIYLKNIDYSKFRQGSNPLDIMQMVTWLGEGYMLERHKAGLTLDLEDMMEKFRIWTDILKKSSYKEEYLDERSH